MEGGHGACASENDDGKDGKADAWILMLRGFPRSKRVADPTAGLRLVLNGNRGIILGNVPNHEKQEYTAYGSRIRVVSEVLALHGGVAVVITSLNSAKDGEAA